MCWSQTGDKFNSISVVSYLLPKPVFLSLGFDTFISGESVWCGYNGEIHMDAFGGCRPFIGTLDLCSYSSVCRSAIAANLNQSFSFKS